MSLAVVLAYAESMIGVPYKWGGDNPIEGFDCGGLVQEILRAAGEWPNGLDRSAQGIYDYLVDRATPDSSLPGTILFYGKSVREISHVAFQVSHYQIMEAGGGDSTTLLPKDAAAKNAFVRVRHISHRSGEIVARLRPRYAGIGLL